MDPHAATPRVSLRSRLAMSVAGFGVGLLAAEGLARQMFPPPPIPGREPQILYEPHPGLGYRFVPGQQGWIDDGWVTINDLGLRGRPPVRPKPDAEFRVLAVGDSTTFGWGVDDHETYPVHLEDHLRRVWDRAPVTVVNAGVSGYDVHQQMRLAQRLAGELTPDLVVVGFYWNDLPYHRATPDGVALAQDLPPERATGTAFRMGTQPSRWNRILRSSRLLYVARRALPAGGVGDPRQANALAWEEALLDGADTPAIEAAWLAADAAVGDEAAALRAQGIAVALVVMPVREQVVGPAVGTAYQDRVRALAARHDIATIDPLPAFRAADEPASLFVPYDRVHLSARGNALLAEAVAAALAAHPVAPSAGEGD